MQERKKRTAILTLGCRVNQSESSVIEGTLKRHGVSIVGLGEKPDVCIVNTCAVTGKSEASSRNLIRKAARTGARVIVTGCFSQRGQEEVRALEGVCEIVPSSDKEKIISHVLGYDVDPIYSLHARARPYLKVQDGCNFSCSYCAVPMARGGSRSLPIDEVVTRAKDIAAQGYREIVLTGIHLGGYGRDLVPRASLAGLIRNILSSTSLFRIRLSSIEINEIDDELIELLAEPRVCRHLHLPLQSGSDRILRLMNRNYTAQTYHKRMLRLSTISPDIAFGADVIVGFPGEGAEEFKATYKLLNDLPFSYIHTFPFSARKGTLASTLKPQVSGNIIADRASIVKELSSARKRAFASAQVNKILDVIAEEQDLQAYMSGTTSNYLTITVKSKRIRRGSAVFVRSVASDNDHLSGVLIS